MKEFADFIQESTETSKQDVVDLLMDLHEQTETPLEDELVNLIISLVKQDKMDVESYDALFDAIDNVMEYETEDLGIDYDEEMEDDEEEEVEEAARALYKRAGYVTCPNGRIRKRGKCGKPLDRSKSRKMIKARKKNKKVFKRAQRKSLRTKRRMGMIK